MVSSEDRTEARLEAIRSALEQLQTLTDPTDRAVFCRMYNEDLGIDSPHKGLTVRGLEDKVQKFKEQLESAGDKDKTSYQKFFGLYYSAKRISSVFQTMQLHIPSRIHTEVMTEKIEEILEQYKKGHIGSRQYGQTIIEIVQQYQKKVDS